MAKTVSETVLPRNIQLWKQVMDSLPEHVFNFVRKAMMSQLPTLHNLKLWNCSSTNLFLAADWIKQINMSCLTAAHLLLLLSTLTDIIRSLKLWSNGS